MTTNLVTEPASRRRAGRRLRWLTQAVFVIAALASVLALGGVVYEVSAVRGDARAYPPPGRLVDVDGFRLHIHCVGAGSPTIVLDAGLGGSSLDWSLVQPELATTARVCAYDRAGMGWSDPSPRVRTPSTMAEELHTLLANAEIAGPYVLVAHSLSGKHARLFSLYHRDEVAGMVLVDVRSEYVDALTGPAENRAFIEAVEAQGRQYGLARRFGFARLFGAELAGSQSIPAETRRLMALLGTKESAISATTGEARARAMSDAALQAASGLDAMPLIVLASDQSIAAIPHWEEAQRRLAALSTAGRVVIASGSSHNIHLDQPRQVIELVREVVSRARLQRQG